MYCKTGRESTILHARLSGVGNSLSTNSRRDPPIRSGVQEILQYTGAGWQPSTGSGKAAVSSASAVWSNVCQCHGRPRGFTGLHKRFDASSPSQDGWPAGWLVAGTLAASCTLGHATTARPVICFTIGRLTTFLRTRMCLN